jgi:hypothetical protein
MDMKLAIYAHQPKEVAHLPLETLEQWAKNNPSSINIWMIYCKKLLQQNHPDFQSVRQIVINYTVIYMTNLGI